jgi:hypothetical protein
MLTIEMVPRRKPIRCQAILNAANGQTCTVCGNISDTVVFAHLNESFAGKGMSQKADDFAGFFACQRCHDLYDGRIRNEEVDAWVVMRAMYRTWRSLIDEGVIVLK